MMLPRATRVLEIGASRVRCGDFVLGRDRTLSLRRFSEASCDASISSDAQWAGSVASALAGLAVEPGPSGAVLGLPGHLALTKFIKTPAVHPSKRDKILQFEAAQNIPYPLSEVVFDHTVVAQDGLDLEIMLTAAKVELLRELCAAASAAGTRPSAAVPGCLALCRAFRYNYPEVLDRVLILAVGARSTHLLFIDADRYYVRTIALAGNSLTQSIAEELRIEFAQAEALKVQVLSRRVELPLDSPGRRAVERAADAFLGRLQIEITRSVLNLRRQAGGEGAAAIYLTGGAAQADGWAGALAARLNVPVHPLDALRRVKVEAAAAEAVGSSSPACLAELVGLAAPLAGIQNPDANLLPPELARREISRRCQPWLIAAAAMISAAALPPLWYYRGAVKQAEQQLAGLEAELRPARAIQSRNASNLAALQEVRQQIDALHGLVSSKSNWINFLTDLQSRLVKVEDVWLERLVVSRPPASDRDSANPSLRLVLSGRLLDRKNPLSKVSTDSNARVRRLLESFKESRFIAEVENERFDNLQPGILRFDFTLVVDEGNPL